MKNVGSVVLFALLTLMPACCIFQGRPAREHATLARQLEEQTAALVRWYDKQGNVVASDSPLAYVPKPYCAATWVSDETMITAEHCITDTGKPSKVLKPQWFELLMGLQPGTESRWNPVGQAVTYCIFGDSTGKTCSSYPATIVYADHDNDLALVRADHNVRIPRHRVAQVAPSVEVGEDMHIIGHPDGKWWTYTRGVVSQIRPAMKNANDDPMDSIQISAPIWYGNSGGGAFNDEGDLVGVCSWIRLGNVPNMSFFVHRDTIARTLRHELRR